jgi:hypothetical protein
MQQAENMRCWICGRSRKELEKVVREYWQNERLTKDLHIELMKGDLYLDACFETVALRKRGSKEKMQISVCVICSMLIRQYILDCLRHNLKVIVKTSDALIT